MSEDRKRAQLRSVAPPTPTQLGFERPDLEFYATHWHDTQVALQTHVVAQYALKLEAEIVQLRLVEFAAIRLCNAHRWSYGGAETLDALAEKIWKERQP